MTQDQAQFSAASAFPTEIPRSEEQAIAAQKAAGVTYGWCYTDHKKGLELRPGMRDDDYVLHQPFAAATCRMLTRMGLPLPHPGQVFRGTNHDLLFLESHGVVVRIGHTDVPDLIHPGILQPLGWLDDPDTKISAVIYPGIELYTDFVNQGGDAGLTAVVQSLLSRTQQGIGDITETNLGIVRIRRDGMEVPVPILLDADNGYNGTGRPIDKEEKQILIRSEMGGPRPLSAMIRQCLNGVYDTQSPIADWRAAFEVHQPLRTAYWMAWCNRDPHHDDADPARLQRFWDLCAKAATTVQRVLTHEWEDTKTRDSAPAEAYRQRLSEFTLYKAWTGKDDDKKTRRIGAAAAFDPYLQQLAQDESALAAAPVWMRSSRLLMGLAQDKNPESYRHAAAPLMADAFYLLKVAEKAPQPGDVFRRADASLQRDPVFAAQMIESVKNKALIGQIVRALPRDIDGYEDLALLAAERYAPAFAACAPDLRDDRAHIGAALGRNIHVYNALPPEWQADPDIAMAVLRKDGNMFPDMPQSIRHSKPHLLTALDKSRNGFLDETSDALRDDAEVVEKAVRRDPYCLAHASDRLIEQIAPDLLRQNGNLFRHLPEKWRANKDLAMIAGQQRHVARDLLKFLAPPLDNDTDLIEIALAAKASLHTASPEVRANQALVERFMEHDRFAYEHAAESLKSVPDLAFKAIMQEPRNYQLIGPDLKQDISFMAQILSHRPDLLERSQPDIRNNRDVLYYMAQFEGGAERLCLMGDTAKQDPDIMLALLSLPHVMPYHLPMPPSMAGDPAFVARVAEIRPELRNNPTFANAPKDGGDVRIGKVTPHGLKPRP